MKKNILSFVTVTVIIFSACAQQKKATASKTAVETKKSTPAIEQVVMERTPCFGTCPAYKLEVNKSGKVVFTSWSNTKAEGVFEKTFEPGKVQELFAQFEKKQVDTCKEEYDNMIPDVPGVNFYFKYDNGIETRISNAHFGPEFLQHLALATDKFSGVDDTWEKTAEAGNKN